MPRSVGESGKEDEEGCHCSLESRAKQEEDNTFFRKARIQSSFSNASFIRMLSVNYEDF